MMRSISCATPLVALLIVAGCGGQLGGNDPTSEANLSACGATTWQAGHWYATGSVVLYSNGKYYIATHDNPGYDPTISTWYWSPYSCSTSSCDATTVRAGQWYATGSVVQYSNGKHYIATHDNPGYDPTISTWYWSPYSCSGGSGGGGGGSGGGGGGSSGGGGGSRGGGRGTRGVGDDWTAG